METSYGMAKKKETDEENRTETGNMYLLVILANLQSNEYVFPKGEQI